MSVGANKVGQVTEYYFKFIRFTKRWYIRETTYPGLIEPEVENVCKGSRLIAAESKLKLNVVYGLLLSASSLVLRDLIRP